MSRADRFDQADFDARYGERVQVSEARPVPARAPRGVRLVGPIARAHLLRVGESVLLDRDGKGRPHKGVDLFAAAGTEVLSASRGHVLRIVDGRTSASATQPWAGLFVDVRDPDGLVFRYLHLPSCGDAARARPRLLADLRSRRPVLAHGRAVHHVSNAVCSAAEPVTLKLVRELFFLVD